MHDVVLTLLGSPQSAPLSGGSNSGLLSVGCFA